MSLSLYVFPYSDALVLKPHAALQFSRLLNMCSRGNLIASLNSSIVFPFYLFDSESICFGALSSLSPTFVDNVKDVCLQLSSRDGRDLQEMMALGFPNQFFLWMFSELDTGHLSMDS